MNEYTLITGATSGIGYELVKLFAKDKDNLILVARNEEKLNEIKKDLVEKYNIDVVVIPMDLSVIENSKKLYDKTKELNLKVVKLINNAGFGDSCEFINCKIDKINQMIDLNMKALTNLTYYFANDMKENKYGRILNVASVASYLAGPYMSVYYATKAYVMNFSVALAVEMKKYNVKISILCPGPTKTDFAHKAEFKNENSFNKYASKPEKVAKIAYKKFRRGKLIINPGFTVKLIAFGTRIMPRKFAAKRSAGINNSRVK